MNKNNIISESNFIPKLVSFLTLIVALFLLGYANKEDSMLLLVLGTLFVFYGFWLLFFGKSYRYIDINDREIVTLNNWLLSSSKKSEPVSNFKSITITGTPIAGGLDINTPRNMNYFVMLVHKNSSRNDVGGDKNLTLGRFRGQKEKAIELADKISEKINIISEVNI